MKLRSEKTSMKYLNGILNVITELDSRRPLSKSEVEFLLPKTLEEKVGHIPSEPFAGRTLLDTGIPIIWQRFFPYIDIPDDDPDFDSEGFGAQYSRADIDRGYIIMRKLLSQDDIDALGGPEEINDDLDFIITKNTFIRELSHELVHLLMQWDSTSDTMPAGDEETIAELGSAFVCLRLKILSDENADQVVMYVLNSLYSWDDIKKVKSLAIMYGREILSKQRDWKITP